MATLSTTIDINRLDGRPIRAESHPMDFRRARLATQALGLAADEADLVKTTFACHEVLDKVLRQFNGSEFAYKRAERARLLGKPECQPLFRAQDDAFNTDLVSTLSGGLRLAERIGAAAAPDLRRRLDAVLTHGPEAAAYRRMLEEDYIRLHLTDDTVDPNDALLEFQALKFHLDIARHDGFAGLLRELHLGLEVFAKLRCDADKGRRILSEHEAREATFLTGGPAPFRSYDFVHIWGLKWVTVLKLVVRAVCYVFIVCLLWEEPEYIAELKSIRVCKYVPVENPS